MSGSSSEVRAGDRGLKYGPSVSGGVAWSPSPQAGVAAGGTAWAPTACAPASARAGTTTDALRNSRRLWRRDGSTVIGSSPIDQRRRLGRCPVGTTGVPALAVSRSEFDNVPWDRRSRPREVSMRRSLVALVLTALILPAAARAEVVHQAYSLPSGGGYPHDV